MSNEEFENYIALVSRLLQLRGKQQEQISVELRDHLQTPAAELESTGETKQAALRQAIEEFGDAAAMAKNFQSVQNLKRQRWMMRFTTFAIAGVFLATLFTMSMWPGEARFGAPESSIAQTVADDPFSDSYQPPTLTSGSAKRDAAAEKALEMPTNMVYEETQFADVMAELEERSRLNFILHESAIDDSLTEEELVTCNVRGVPLAKALDLMLSTFNATYTIDEGIVVIISKDNRVDPEFLRLKMFDCKKLVEALGNTGDDKLLKLVQSTVDPDSWRRDGFRKTSGGEGHASVLEGILIVKHSEPELRHISEMLKDLRGKILGKREIPTTVSKRAPIKKRKKMTVKKQEPRPSSPVSNKSGNPFANEDPFKDKGDPFKDKGQVK